MLSVPTLLIYDYRTARGRLIAFGRWSNICRTTRNRTYLLKVLLSVLQLSCAFDPYRPLFSRFTLLHR